MSRSRRHHNRGQGILGFVNIGLLTLTVLLGALLIFAIYTYKLLNFNHLDKIVVGSLVVFILINLGLIVLKKLRLVTAVVLLLAVLGQLASLFFIKSFIDVSDKMNMTARFSEVEMSVIVPADSDITSVNQIKEVMAPLSSDKENIEALLADVTQKKEHNLTVTEEATYIDAYEKLLSGEQKAMIINGAYASLLESSHSDYASKVKKVYTYSLQKAIPTSERPVANGQVMTLYISGVDTYGPISTVSRSDVNILTTINRQTNKILLTTTPRDSYVPIAGGGQGANDKLTHAGIYGIDSSIETLENLYDIPIDYYAKINFTSFLTLIDLLGGIEVDNDQAFSAGGFDFPVGKIVLNSEQALAFVRERYSLEHGDNDRGKNQLKVLTGIIQKLSSVEAMTNYQQMINGLGESVQTNMPLVVMMDLANDQLASGRHYTITSQALEGTGSTGELPSHAMPGSALYMFTINPDSLASAKEAIKATMEGR